MSEKLIEFLNGSSVLDELVCVMYDKSKLTIKNINMVCMYAGFREIIRLRREENIESCGEAIQELADVIYKMFPVEKEAFIWAFVLGLIQASFEEEDLFRLFCELPVVTDMGDKVKLSKLLKAIRSTAAEYEEKAGFGFGVERVLKLFGC